MKEIKRLPEQVVNQIAAGEVVERPASVLKELIENALDSGATSIDVLLELGGTKRIEVRDNGKGIEPDDLGEVFARYATSKIKEFEDLDSLSSYGFRGEALASIAAVSTTKIISSKNGEAHTAFSRFGELDTIVPASRGQGTTVIVENLFERIPGRQKFLKKPETEYRYMLEIFQYFALLNGTIHFSLTHNNKIVYTLPATDEMYFPLERVASIFKESKDKLIRVSHKEYGLECVGVVFHPSLLGTRSKVLLQYVNGRPVQDKGVVRAVQQGLQEYIPDTYKAAGIIGVFLPSDQVDVNVHPRKMEVKFLNPFRVYSAVTHAVKLAYATSLRKETTTPLVTQYTSRENSSFQAERATSPAYRPTNHSSQVSFWDKRDENAYARLRGNNTIYTGSSFVAPEEDLIVSSQEAQMPRYELERVKDALAQSTIIPVLSRYIIVALEGELWIVDQHAAAERIRFEQFKRAYQESKPVEQQQLLTPIVIPLSEIEKQTVEEHLQFFEKLGFGISVHENALHVSSLPLAIQRGDIELLLRDTLAELVEQLDVFTAPVIADFASERDLSMVIATMACHNSVRMNQSLSIPEAKGIMSDLLACKVPYACPHGRRVVWKLTKEEIDKNFMRT